MKKIILASLALFTFALQGQSVKDVWKKTKEEVKKDVKEVKQDVTGKPSLSNDEIIQGLREALNVGSTNSTSLASKTDGYLKNARLFIPFPPEAIDMRNKLVKLGMQKKVDEFETSLNRAAEEAAKSAAPVFLEAIRNMSIGDGMTILRGSDTAATRYLKDNTSAQLDVKFRPIVKDAIEKVKVTSYWTPLVSKYNKIPGVKKQNPDLEAYVTQRAIAGLFILVADEEAKIRRDPMARVNDILKKVFGYNDSQKK
ncbi:MAG: DUF4197 domain-containing protein [Bacteroidia bacterium]